MNNYFFLDSVSFFYFFDYSYIVKNIDYFFDTYNLLKDDVSKNTLIAFINAKISGIPKDLYDLVVTDQYFPSEIIKLSDNEIFIDGGAYNGDTISIFIEKTNKNYQSIFAFEPDNTNFKNLTENIHKNCLENIIAFEIGLWNKKDKLKFNLNIENSVKSSIQSDGIFTLYVDTIDNIIQDTKVSFIKLDIEGAEYNALKGAEYTIIRNKPKIAVCMYHKPEDLITIPQYLKKIVPEYKFFLRQHLHISQELVLYAIID